jgi:hypothetical protein
MSFVVIVRRIALLALAAPPLWGCQGDDNALALPPDAGSDARADATVHEGGIEASSEASAQDVAEDTSVASDVVTPGSDAQDSLARTSDGSEAQDSLAPPGDGNDGAAQTDASESEEAGGDDGDTGQ